MACGGVRSFMTEHRIDLVLDTPRHKDFTYRVFNQLSLLPHKVVNDPLETIEPGSQMLRILVRW